MRVSDRPLVLDFGMHRGEDTAFYLAIGARVIAFEANAELSAATAARFAHAISEGRLKIIEGAIVPPDHVGDTVTFYRDSRKSVWGTASSEWAQRNVGLGSAVEQVKVPAIRLDEVLAGQPPAFHAKIDIEGADLIVLQALSDISMSPQYVSIESSKLDLRAIRNEVDLLCGMGYTRFAAVQQANIPGCVQSGIDLTGRPFSHRFEPDASGPFGDYLRQPWRTADEILEDYRAILRKYDLFGDRSWLMQSALARAGARAVNKAMLYSLGIPLCGWYDTHAAR